MITAHLFIFDCFMPTPVADITEYERLQNHVRRLASPALRLESYTQHITGQPPIRDIEDVLEMLSAIAALYEEKHRQLRAKATLAVVEDFRTAKNIRRQTTNPGKLTFEIEQRTDQLWHKFIG